MAEIIQGSSFFYFPGKRKIKKGKAPPPSDGNVFYGLTEYLPDDADVDLPAKFWKETVADFNKGYRLLYGGGGTRSFADARSGAEDLDESVGTDSTEYAEMPGILSTPLYLNHLWEKGVPAVAQNLWESIYKNAINFRDISIQSELNYLWIPSMLGYNPDIPSTAAPSGTRQAIGLAPAYFMSNWRAADPSRFPTNNNAADWQRAGVNMWLLPNLQNAIGDVVLYGYSPKREDKFRAFQQANVDVIGLFLSQSPQALDPSLSPAQKARVNGLRARLARVEALRAEFKRLDNISSARSRTPFPAVFSDVRAEDAKRDYERELDKFYEDLLRNRDGLADTVARYSDPRFVAWSHIVVYRHNVFMYTEYIDSIAEGNFFKNVLYSELFKTGKIFGYDLFKSRLKYLTPAFYTTNFMNYVKNFALWRRWNAATGKYVDINLQFLYNKLLEPFDRATRWITSKMVNSVLGRTLGAFAPGGVQKLISQWVTKLLMGAGATGVGAAPAIVAAAVGWISQKLFDLTKSLIRGDLDKFAEDISKAFSNFLKLAMGVAATVVGCCIFPLVLVIMAFSSTLGGIGSTIGIGGSNVPGGSLPCGTPSQAAILQDEFNKTQFANVVSYPNIYFSDCFNACRTYGKHGGVDITAGGISGSPILSPYQGEAEVVYNHWNADGFGYLVILKSPSNPYYMYFAHMPELGPVPVGETVNFGDQIGKVDSTGYSTGAHLHFEIRSGGQGVAQKINPCFVNPGSCSAIESHGGDVCNRDIG